MKTLWKFAVVILSALFIFSACSIPLNDEIIAKGNFLPAPAGLNAAPETTNSIKIIWPPVSGAELYKLYRSSNMAGPYSPIDTTTAPPYTDTGLSSDTTLSVIASAYTRPIPLSDGTWFFKGSPILPNWYYSFPVNPGTYYIQWANAGLTGVSNNTFVTVYLNNENSMENLGDKTNFYLGNDGFPAPRSVIVTEPGYIILKANNNVSFEAGYTYYIRYYKDPEE
jgi:hypothetical protein